MIIGLVAMRDKIIVAIVTTWTWNLQSLKITILISTLDRCAVPVSVCEQGPLIQWAGWARAQGPELQGAPSD